jgi:dCTP deaminase
MRERLVDDDEADVSEGVAVGVDLSGSVPIGWWAIAPSVTAVIDVERRSGYDVADSGADQGARRCS